MKKLPVIDFHTHILPHMDDGSRNTEMSLDMLREMKESGVDIAVATSHYYHRNESVDRFLARREEMLSHLFEKAAGEQIPAVIPGAEVAFYFGIEEEKELDRLCIAGTRALLLEMPFASWTSYELNAVSSLCYDRKLTVILAHYERFAEFQKENKYYSELAKLPVLIQINAASVLPLFSGRRWIKMFGEGQAHLLGSDAHNMSSRAPNLSKARALLGKKLGEEVLVKIDETGAKLLGLAGGSAAERKE